MEHELRLEAMRIAAAQALPCTPISDIIAQAELILTFLRG
jgi:hypothetical protein